MMVICLMAILVKADTDSAIDLHLKNDDTLDSYDDMRKNNLRELRGRGGGRSSRYSGSRSYSRSSRYTARYNKNYAATNNYKYAYSRYANPTSYSNSYYSVSKARTSRPLYVYYRAPNYFNARGYYSTVFLLVYYNGYGYNFYYGRYGYYEYSINQTDPGQTNDLAGVIILIVCCGCVIGSIIYLIKTHKYEEGDEEYGSEDYGSEEVVEEVHIEEKHYNPHAQQPGYYGGPPQQYHMGGPPPMSYPVQP
jgi:hypothetical protein